jgi:hypothetical protein
LASSTTTNKDNLLRLLRLEYDDCWIIKSGQTRSNNSQSLPPACALTSCHLLPPQPSPLLLDKRSHCKVLYVCMLSAVIYSYACQYATETNTTNLTTA